MAKSSSKNSSGKKSKSSPASSVAPSNAAGSVVQQSLLVTEPDAEQYAPTKPEATKKRNSPKRSAANSQRGNEGDVQFLLPIHEGNLGTIFSSAIIVPAKYVPNRAFADEQTDAGETIFLTTDDTRHRQPETILLNVRLTREEASRAVKAENGFYYPLPIALSRAISVRFADEKQERDAIARLATLNSGILPTWMPRQQEMPLAEASADILREEADSPQPDVPTSLRKFDSILGAYAFLRNYGILAAEGLNGIQSLPEHVFQIGQAISDVEDFKRKGNGNALRFYRQIFGVDEENRKPEVEWFANRLQERRTFTKSDTEDFAEVLRRSGASAEFQQQAAPLLQRMNDPLEFKAVLLDILGLKDASRFYLYLLAFLRRFGNPESNDAMASRKGAITQASSDWSEYVFACLGYFHGYRALRNYEESSSKLDETLSLLGVLKRLPLKLDLETTFDLAMIESAYQVAFRMNASFSNIAFLPAVAHRAAQPELNLPTGYEATDSVVLGKALFSVKKSDAPALPGRVPIISEIGLHCWRKKIPYDLMSLRELIEGGLKNLPYFISFSSEIIQTAMREGRLDAAEVSARLKLTEQLDHLA